ncbi:MAG: hypothetical protein K0R38_6906 [Polyangiaceae bacterium]|nr:hypothetical protein [Polyangiaceae bacterium]
MDSELEYLLANAMPVQNDAVDGLPLDTVAVLVALLDDSVAQALLSLPRLRALVHRGNSSITDAGLQHLETLSTLEALDLEWSSAITGRGLRNVAKLRNLRWLDLSFCPAITREDVSELQRALPQCEVEFG